MRILELQGEETSAKLDYDKEARCLTLSSDKPGLEPFKVILGPEVLPWALAVLRKMAVRG